MFKLQQVSEPKPNLPNQEVQNRLHEMSQTLQNFAAKVNQTLNESDDDNAQLTESLEILQHALEHVQKAMGNVRTKMLQGISGDLVDYKADLDSQLTRFNEIVDVVNHVNILLDIGTQVVAIAAGLAKL